MSLQDRINAWASVLERDLLWGSREDARSSLELLLQYSEMTPELSKELEAFERIMRAPRPLSKDDVTNAVQRLAVVAKAAGPNDRAQSLLQD